LIIKFVADETQSIEHTNIGEIGEVEAVTKLTEQRVHVVRVHCNLILGGIANQALTLRGGGIRWGCAVNLVVRDNFQHDRLPDTNATELEM
jgi:hypothetical protein